MEPRPRSKTRKIISVILSWSLLIASTAALIYSYAHLQAGSKIPIAASFGGVLLAAYWIYEDGWD